MANSKRKFKKTDKKEVEELTEEELKSQFFDAKEDKESIFLKVLSIVLWTAVFVWIAICLIDFYRTQKREEPLFTFKNDVIEYDDGHVDSYLGLGYRIYNYKRKCFDGFEFGPFWTKDKSIEAEKCNK